MPTPGSACRRAAFAGCGSCARVDSGRPACVVGTEFARRCASFSAKAAKLDLGEPAASKHRHDPARARRAAVLVRGRRTDVVLMVPRRDARRLVLRAFGSRTRRRHGARRGLLGARVQASSASPPLPPLGPLCAQRAEGSQRILADEAPACVAYFDLRVRSRSSSRWGGIVRASGGRATWDVVTGALDEVALRSRRFRRRIDHAADFVRFGGRCREARHQGRCSRILESGSGRLARASPASFRRHPFSVRALPSERFLMIMTEQARTSTS